MPDMLLIDHVFVFVESEGAEIASLQRQGMTENFRRAHPGQGTANACFCFDNAYLELLWVESAAEISAPALARTGLAERAAWRRNGACPFGIAFRTEPADAPLPFATWDYSASFLPEDRPIAVALSSDDARQPFLFRSPGSVAPARWTDGRAGTRQQTAGLRDIVGIELDLPAGLAPCRALEDVERAGVITLNRGAAAHRLTLHLSRRSGNASVRLLMPDFVVR